MKWSELNSTQLKSTLKTHTSQLENVGKEGASGEGEAGSERPSLNTLDAHCTHNVTQICINEWVNVEESTQTKRTGENIHYLPYRRVQQA